MKNGESSNTKPKRKWEKYWDNSAGSWDKYKHEKTYNNVEEIQKLLEQLKNYLRPNTFLETAKNLSPNKSTMKILEGVASSLDNFLIITCKDYELQVQFSNEIFGNYFQRLIQWNKKEKINCCYTVDRNIYGFKAIIIPKALQILVFNLLQFGLIECLYLNTNSKEISLFT